MERTEIDNRPETELPDAEALQVKESESQSFEEREKTLVALWDRRFKQAEVYRRPYIERNLRMYKLYRAYREAINYAYGTSLMPPIGFEIIETVKPRLASADISIDLFPTQQAHVDDENISKWDDLIEYDLDQSGFADKKIDWIDAMLKFGNGTLQIGWDGSKLYLEVVDNWLFYPDPKAGKRLEGSRWEIKQLFKSKAELERDERDREDNPLYILETGENEDGSPKSIIHTDRWEKITDQTPLANDPRRERYRINTLKMGQINDGKKKNQTTNEGESDSGDKDAGEKVIEVWECFDHIEGKLQVIFNRESLVRDEDNPYATINGGQVFIDLPDISLPWEYYAMGHLEPVETTIHEIADSRNQAMDNIVFNLDPIKKVKKGAGYRSEDLVNAPGAVWQLNKADDVVYEKPPEISRQWIEKDEILRREIQTSLALSEYTQGMPKSSQEPASKVELLLMQTNIRFSLVVRQLELAMNQLVNAIIQMNQEFLDEDKALRLLGDNFRFTEFTEKERKVGVDAVVKVRPKREKSPAQEKEEVSELYRVFVVDDVPGEGATPDEQYHWKRKKAELQRVMLQKFGYEELEDILIPEVKRPEPEPPAPETPPEPPMATLPGVMGEDPLDTGSFGDLPQPGMLQQQLPQPEELLPLEQTMEPGAETSLTGGGGIAGMLQRLIK